jgi:hypothetical protein
MASSSQNPTRSQSRTSRCLSLSTRSLSKINTCMQQVDRCPCMCGCKANWKLFAIHTLKLYQEHTRFLLGAHGKTYMSTPTSTTRVQLHSAPRLLATRLHGLYVNLIVRRGYSSPGHSSSTSTTPYAAATPSSGCTTTSTTISTSKLVENGFHGINN